MQCTILRIRNRYGVYYVLIFGVMLQEEIEKHRLKLRSTNELDTHINIMSKDLLTVILVFSSHYFGLIMMLYLCFSIVCRHFIYFPLSLNIV